MTTRLMKEARDQAPVLAGTLLLMAALYALWGDRVKPIGLFVFALGCGILGAGSFGNELRHRTLSLLLSQPVPRKTIWREKMLALGGGLGAMVVTLFGCHAIFGRLNLELLPVALIPLCVFCGAPCLTLASRSAMVGLVSAAGCPWLVVVGGILASRLVFGREVTEDRAAILVGFLLVAYCAFIYWLGYRTFRELQVVDGPSRELKLPAWLNRGIALPWMGSWASGSGPVSSLVRKELWLQQASFLTAGLFCLVAVVGACAYWIQRDFAVALLGGDCAVYVIIIPFIVGAIAVGEEREWGVAEWHLSLPPSGRKQWLAKMMVALPTSLALGVVLPFALFMAGRWILSGHGNAGSFPGLCLILMVVASSILMTSLAAYTATFTRGTLEAILWAFGLVLAGSCLGALVTAHASRLMMQWVGHRPGLVSEDAQRLGYWLLGGSLLLVSCLIQAMAWSNFRQFGLSRRRIVGQLAAFFCFVALVAAIASIFIVVTAVGK